MVVNASLKKKSLHMKEWIAQADLQKKPVGLKEWMTSRNSSLEIEWSTTLKKWRLQVVFWKNIFYWQQVVFWKKYIHHKGMKRLQVLSFIQQDTFRTKVTETSLCGK